nr:zf-CCHC domain-containing protein/DUF4219 domain-containing protein/UBN2 domain-containing protein [Tanacetum cinerariifolium]
MKKLPPREVRMKNMPWRCFKFGDPNHFIGDSPKRPQRDQKSFDGGSWSDSEEEEEVKKDEICLMAYESSESSRKFTDLAADTSYYSRPIRRIQDFDESKDHCLTLKNTPYPHQRYAIYNTLVNEEEPTGFSSIRRIHQEDTRYPCLHYLDNHEGLKTYMPYPGASICRIQANLIHIEMDDANITMEEYISLEEEKARRRGKVYNWETATYAMVYNDALTSKSDSSTKPVEIPHRIDEFDLKTKTSLFKCDEEKQNILYFNDLFTFNIIHPDDLKSDK